MKLLLRSIFLSLLMAQLMNKISPKILVKSLASQQAYSLDSDDDYDYYEDFACLVNETKCPNDSTCFTFEQKCDGFKDCINGFDESNCTVTTTIEPLTAATTPSSATTALPTLQCSDDEFLCSTDGYFLCLSIEVRCDGYVDCETGKDEMNCNEGITGTLSIERTSSSTEMISSDRSALKTSVVPTFTPRPSSHGAMCAYENQLYEADFLIMSNHCTEVRCSSSGRLLTWTNPDDPTCAAETLHSNCLMLSLIFAFFSICWIL